MELSAAFFLGLIGSVHCAGMCGPLALALPRASDQWTRFLAGRAAYNFGRMAAYSVLGLVFGTVGRSFALAGFQRWVSLAAGVAMLGAVLPLGRTGFGLPMFRTVAWLKRGLSQLLLQRTVTALALIGFLNGFLPCGLVYVACAGALATAGIVAGLAYMVAFGVGTVPMMFAIAVGGRNVEAAFRTKLQRLIPVCVTVLAVLLILRGLGLGIPYLSPALSLAHSSDHCCPVP